MILFINILHILQQQILKAEEWHVRSFFFVPNIYL